MKDYESMKTTKSYYQENDIFRANRCLERAWKLQESRHKRLKVAISQVDEDT